MTRHPPPVDFFEDAFRWHARFLPPMVQPRGLLLMGELDLLMLDAPGVLALAPVLRDGLSLAAHCRAHGMPALLAEMLHALEAMTRQDLVQPAAGEGRVRYLVPDFTRVPMRSRMDAQVDALMLSECVDHDVALHWSQRMPACDAGLTLVFCDDYLDPRLGPVDRAQRELGRPWLLVKPAGERAMVGPVFTPPRGQAATPCWHCLAHRLQRNQPARSWLHARRGGPVPGLPVRADAGLAQARLFALLPLAQDIVARAAAELWTPDPPTPHPVSPRPQCPHCGDPSLMARRQREPVMLAPCPAIAGSDGGWRSMPASATLARLAPHVDALCGAVTPPVPLGAATPDVLAVYRCQTFRTAPVHGELSMGDLVQLCLGKGMSAEQSRASALCEAFERHAAFWQGDEACVVAAPSALDAPCVAPQALALFGQEQRANFGSHRPPHAVQGPSSPAADAHGWWTPAWSLTARARCYLPLSFCHANAPAQSQRHVTWTSNGCAAGNTREEAILQGLLELVERDAAAVWWYGRIRRPAMPLDRLDARKRARIGHTLGTAWRFHVLDITHDFGIPVAAAIGRHHPTGRWAIGFGCSPDHLLACERALSEMVQLIAVDKTLAMPRADGPGDAPAFLLPLQEGGRAPWSLREAAPVTDIAAEIERCVGMAASLGLQTLVLDCTRPDIPLHVVKMVVPGLCHIWPELGNPRLHQVPVAMGWRDAPLQESDLNPQALYV